MKKILSVLLLIAAYVVTAQNTFQPGYYILNDGTRMNCLIKNIAWKDSPKQFEYKASEGSEVLVHTITEVQEFSVDEAYKFRRYDINLDRSATTLDALSSHREPEWSKETAFLKVLVEGKYNLMEFEQGNFKKFFYSAGDHLATEQLLYKQYMQNSTIHENIRFRQQLYNLMKDKWADPSRFEKIVYKRDPLVALFTEYNGNEAKNLTARQNSGKIHFKVVAEARMVSLEVVSPSSIYRTFELDKKTAFAGGIEVEYIMPFNNGKWSIFAAPSYQAYTNSGTSPANTALNLKYNTFEVPLGVRHYFFLNADSRMYVEGAYVLAKTIGKANLTFGNYDIELANGSNVMAGAGFAYKKFNAGLRYTFSRGLSTFQYWSIQYSGIGLSAGYRFL